MITGTMDMYDSLSKDIKSAYTRGVESEIVLYHGSRGGIEGDIQPISRERCDFGRGFYLGENKSQACGLVVDDSDPFLYRIKLDVSKIPNDKILVLNGKEWLYTILACRKRCTEFNELNIAKKALRELKKYDLVIGPIADDRMTEAIRRFENHAMTDKALLECLKYIDYGNQYVCKTKKACGCLTILDEKEIYGKEADDIRKYSAEMRGKGKDIVDQMQVRYQREGFFLNELVDRQKEIEKAGKSHVD